MLMDSWIQIATKRMIPPIANSAAGVIERNEAMGAIIGITTPAMTPVVLKANQPSVYLKLIRPRHARR